MTRTFARIVAYRNPNRGALITRIRLRTHFGAYSSINNDFFTGPGTIREFFYEFFKLLYHAMAAKGRQENRHGLSLSAHESSTRTAIVGMKVMDLELALRASGV